MNFCKWGFDLNHLAWWAKWSNVNEEEGSNIIFYGDLHSKRGAISLCKIYLRKRAIHAYNDLFSSFYPFPKWFQALHFFFSSSQNPKIHSLSSLTQWTHSHFLFYPTMDLFFSLSSFIFLFPTFFMFFFFYSKGILFINTKALFFFISLVAFFLFLTLFGSFLFTLFFLLKSQSQDQNQAYEPNKHPRV